MRPNHFPRAPVARIYREWLKSQGWDGKGEKGRKKTNYIKSLNPRLQLAQDSGVSDEVLKHISLDRHKWIDFDLADRIIQTINPYLWHTDPELSEAYQSFDLKRLDAWRPIEEAA